MGIRAKSKRREKRRQMQRAAKAARKLLYQQYAEQGRTRGSKRLRKRRGPKLVGNDHPHGACGNIGCAKCRPEVNRDRLRSRRAA